MAWESRGVLVRMARGAAASGLVLALALGFLPSALLGLALHDLIERTLFAPVYVAWGLLAGAAGILIVEAAAPRARVHAVDGIPWRTALGVGAAQCLSLFPGVSRSAATILGGMAGGCDRRTATEFSFLLAIPTMLAAGLYDLYHWRAVLTAADAPAFAVGFAAAFGSGLLAVRMLLRYVGRHDFRPFAYYRIAVGLAALWVLGRE